jgi:protein SCO1/2
MSRKRIFYILFFVSLTLAFYFITKKWLKRDTSISTVQPFSFIDQDGKVFTNANVAGKVYVTEFFFTTCTGICPRMNNNMKKVYDRFKDEKDFLIVSHTCDPETDSAAQLKKYADKLGVNTNRWVFLTGRKDSLYNIARLSYQIDDPANNLKSIDDQFLHSQLWALVNKEGKVKKIYDGLKENEVNELMNDISKMLKE